MAAWLVVATSALATTATAPLARGALIRANLLDHPNDRSSHRVATPRGGGIACLVGVTTGSLAALAAGQRLAWEVLLAAALMAAVGFADDLYHLPASPRLLSQIGIGSLLGLSIGGPAFLVVGAVALPIFVNVVNFMDGINGITALTLTVWGTATAITGHSIGSSALTALGASTGAAALGFLPWNAPRAKLFLGDVGSYLFGALAAGGFLLGTSLDAPPTTLLAPLTIYILDVAITLARRALRGARLMQAHREHIYQQLVDTFSAPHIVVSIWVTALTAVVSIAALAGWGAFGLGIVALAMVTYLRSQRIWERVSQLTNRHSA